MIRSDRAARFAYVGEITRARDLETQRRQAREVLQTWQSVWRDILSVRYGAEVALWNPDRTSEIQQFARTVNPEQVIATLRAITDTLEAIRSYVQVRLALENFMLQLPSQ
jgi:hypothetical protein